MFYLCRSDRRKRTENLTFIPFTARLQESERLPAFEPAAASTAATDHGDYQSEEADG
jgi:hypothetical protein